MTGERPGAPEETGDGLAALTRALGAAVPEAFAELSPDEVDRLTELLDAARREQARALAAAVDHGLGFLPRIARGTMKRMLST